MEPSIPQTSVKISNPGAFDRWVKSKKEILTHHNIKLKYINRTHGEVVEEVRKKANSQKLAAYGLSVTTGITGTLGGLPSRFRCLYPCRMGARRSGCCHCSRGHHFDCVSPPFVERKRP